VFALGEASSGAIDKSLASGGGLDRLGAAPENGFDDLAGSLREVTAKFVRQMLKFPVLP
jgi:hypothetical protein